MIDIVDGQLRFPSAPFNHRLVASYRLDNAWVPMALERSGDGFTANHGPVTLRLKLDPGASSIAYQASFTSTYPTRVQLAMLLPDATDPFHLIPGFMFGDNNLGVLPPGQAPNLTLQHKDSPSCSPYWECRADRASHPVSAALWKGALAAMSIQPYSTGKPRVGSSSDDTFIRNGVFVQLAHDGKPAACGVTLGYGNLPSTYFSIAQFHPTTGHFSLGVEAGGTIFLRSAQDRRAVHGVIRELYATHRDKPQPPISREEAARDITRSFLQINWHGDDNRNADGSSSGSASPFLGGKPFRNNFTNMRCNDEQKKHLTAWRTLAEVGWSGGAIIGYPMLRAGVRFNDAVATERGLYKLDCVADAFNPASGLLWDVSGVNEGKRLEWWWSAPPYMNCHCAYTNASAVYYMLKAARFARATPSLAGKEERWIKTSLQVLDTIVRLQLPDGNLGTTYRPDKVEMIDSLGFPGAWFIPALAYAYDMTRDRKYLDTATRALAHYHKDVQALSCWGTPMDVHRFVDHEGNLGFLRGALLLHEFTGSADSLAAAVDSADYEYLWRYGQRTRPQYRPLRGSPWNSCGGSITSSATSMHPMGVYISDELRRLAYITGDTYHIDRANDALDWAANCVALYPEHTGYGARGVITERWCPSDGTAMESFPDGSPSSIWFSYNGWAAAAMLEGLVEAV